MNQVMITFCLGMFIGCPVGFLAAALFFMAKGEQLAVEKVIKEFFNFRQADGGLLWALWGTLHARIRALCRPHIRKDL